MVWRASFPSGDVTAMVLGDPAPDRFERADALRAILPPPRDDERGDLGDMEPDNLVAALKSGAAATARHFGLQMVEGEWQSNAAE